MNTILTKYQEKTFTVENKLGYKLIKAVVRYDDRCDNGHNTFSITGEAYESQREINRNDPSICGCIHDVIEKAFPQLAPFIKWHLVSSDSPMYYIENTMYHAKENQAEKAWFYLVDTENNINKCIVYAGINSPEAQKLQETYGDKIVVKVDERTAKQANLRAARSCAVWPDATIDQLRNKDLLLARLPVLMLKFKLDIESLGFTF